ncbi:hypothetical protein ACOTTU_22515 [Roseobacter sp. EG26]|uniref:hypothetical protein n=1 Tax=Roseobacter sp. EG26 TaxID=3412477 RepID=UPI003CE584A6
MKQGNAGLTAQWNGLSRQKALLLGLLSGLVTTLVPVFIFGNSAFVFGFLGLFPFWARLTLQAVFKGPFFHYFFGTKYGVYCVGWFYTWILLSWAFFDLN